MRRRDSLQGRLTLAASIVAFVAIAVLTLAFNVVLSRSLDSDANSRLRAEAAAAATTVTLEHGRLRVREAATDETVDRRVWIYSGRRAIARPLASRSLQRAADALAIRAPAFKDLPHEEVRFYASPIVEDGRPVGAVVAAESLTAYDRTTDVALFGSLGLGAVLLAAVFLLTRSVIVRALRPVRQMTRSAAEWSENDPGRRFGGEPRPDELGELARTFDALLDRVASSLRHEQQLSAELSHELRTPLARIVAEVELLQRRDRPADERTEAYAAIARSAEQMSGMLETLMAAARADAGLDHGRADLAAVLGRLEETWTPVFAERRIALEVDPGGGALFAGVDPEVVERAVTPLLDNARRHASARVRLTARRDGGRVTVSVADDGPGLPPGAGEGIFEPGVSVSRANGHQGAGLGLALARRLARAAGGDVVAVDDPGDGAELRVVLPAYGSATRVAS